MKIIFMGTPDFSVPSLKALIENDKYDVVGVYSQPPRPAGRGKKLKKSAIHLVAEENNIKVFTPKSLRDKNEQQKLFDLKPDFIIVAAYGLILPKEVIDFCPCINIHASILPRWRGAAPIHRAILAGDKATGITIMKMDIGLDTGDILIKKEVEISDVETTGSLHDNLSDLGAKLIIDYLENYKNIEPESQNEIGITYADKIKKSESRLNFNNNGIDILRKIRAFNPYPAANFLYNNEKINIFEAEFKKADKIKSIPATIVDDRLTIACKDGLIYPKLVQRSGKKLNKIDDFLRGFKFNVADKVS